MQVNKVPKKLYCCDKGNGNLFVDYRPFPNNESIEYIRTDVFIEKAIDWLQKGLDNGLWVDQHLDQREKEAVIEHFKEWMKE